MGRLHGLLFRFREVRFGLLQKRMTHDLRTLTNQWRAVEAVAVEGVAKAIAEGGDDETRRAQRQLAGEKVGSESLR